MISTLLRPAFNARTLALAALLTMSGVAGQAFAQDAAAAKPDVAAAISPESSAKAKAILERAAKAAAELKTVSYVIKTEANVKSKTNAMVTGFQVDLARGTDGAWRVRVLTHDATDTTKLTPVRVAFDGKTARSVDVPNRIVNEATFASLDEAQTFLAKFRARAAVLWDVFGKEPLNAALGAPRMIAEASAEVNGQKCDVVRVDLSAPNRKPGIDEGNLPGYRFYFSAEDHIVRKIERFRATPEGQAFGDFDQPQRVITLTNIAVDKPISDDTFTIATPDGYSVKLPDGSIREATTEAKADPSKALESGDPKLIAVGSDAPDWLLKTAEGGDLRLTDYRGKLVLMDFWATWCGPCKAAMPGVQRLHEKYKDRGLVVIGLATWDKGDPKKYMDEKQYTYNLVLKADDVATAYRVTGIPTFYIIGPDGKVLYNAVGYDPEHEEQIAALVEKYLPEKK
ncbi:MAG: TlpA disulfide reductase family protein [Planctomycetota bacterium]|nr:TlpA disulfide reductase family protein [Planctomycetota bacterium]